MKQPDKTLKQIPGKTKNVRSTAAKSAKKVATRKRQKPKNWRLWLESWLADFDYTFLRVAISLLLIHEVAFYLSIQFR